MNEHSSTQSFSSHLHQHHQHLHQLPSYHLSLPSLQAPGLGYPSSQPGPEPLEPLEEAESREEDSATPGGRRARGGSDRRLLATSSLNGDANPDGEPGASGHFPHTYEYCTSKREDVWEEGESFDSAAESFYSRENGCLRESQVFHLMNPNMEGIRQNFSADPTEASMSQQAPPFTRSASDGPEYCRTSSTMSDNYGGRDEDFGSSCGSGEDHLQPAEMEGAWFSTSPPGGAAGRHSGDLAQHSPVSIGSGTYPQKLDSFSDAFLTQRRGRFPIIPRDDPGGQIWEFGRGGSPRTDLSRQSCAFELDPYLPPASSSSPFHSSFASFPSTSSPLVSAVLSPPPTPRPPPSFSPAAFGGSGHPTSHGGDPLGPLQFFASYSPSLPSVQPSGMVWKLPLMAHSFSPSPALKVDCDFSNFSVAKGNLRPHSDITASQKRESPESFQASGLPPSGLRPSTVACLPPPYHLPSLPAQQNEVADGAGPFLLTQKKPADVINPAQQQLSQIYTGTPFPSILRSGRGQRKGRYTPRPLLNPARRGTGLFFNLSPQHHRDAVEGGGDGGVLACVNVGDEFQAELPPSARTRDGTFRWRADEESPREQLLWKPWQDLEDIVDSQDQVEKLLSLCSSSCLPGGGSNTELALHCLHSCRGDTMATLEMLLFSHPSPAGDYHYSGSDFWTDAEKSLFNTALGTYGKEFSLIWKTVRTKTVQQCVEFFYLNKRLQDKQEKQKRENQDGGLGQHAGATPNFKPMSRAPLLEEVLPLSSLASVFPCKLCGKMFYKIKSRNAHMKIHRQPPDDWANRRLQQQLLSQRSGANLHPAQVPFRSVPSPCLPGRTRNADIVLNLLAEGSAPSIASVLDPGAMVTCSNNVALSVSAEAAQREPSASRGPFYQSWGSFGAESAAFYCSAEGKDDGGAGALGGKEPIRWQ